MQEKMGRAFRRFISLLMILCMAVSLLPTGALAADSLGYWAQSESAAKSGNRTAITSVGNLQSFAKKNGYICLEQDVSVIEPLEVSGKVTMDLNGHVLRRVDGKSKKNLIKENGDYTTRNSGEVILVSNGGELTIVDSSPGTKHDGKFVYADGKESNGELWWCGSGGDAVFGGIITGGSGYNCGGGIVVKGGKVVMKAGTIAGNLTRSSGGGVQIEAGGTLEMFGGSIFGNAAVKGKNGGGVAVENGYFIVHTGRLERNYSDSYGGAIYVNKTLDRSIYMNGTVSGSWNQESSYPILIKNNKAKYGAALYVNNTKGAFVTGAYFSGNTAGSDGGAVYVNTGDTISFSKCFLTGNRAGDSGGAFYLNRKDVSISETLITGNSADKRGGGIYNNAANSISGSVVTDNRNCGVYDNSKLSLSGKMVIKNNESGNLNIGSKGNLGAGSMDNASEVWITAPGLETGAILSRSPTNAKPDVFHMDDSRFYVAYGNDPSISKEYRRLYVTTSPTNTVSWTEVSLSGSGKTDPAHPLVDEVTTKGYHNDYTNQDYDLQRGYYRFESTDNAGGYSEGLATYYYSDGFFAQDPVIYSEQLATMTLALTTSAATMPDEAGNEVEDYTNRFGFLLQTLSDLGFADENIQINDWYTKRPTENSIGVAVAAKKLAVGDGLSTADTTLYLVPIMIRGSGYEKEWMSNVTVSEGNYGMSTRKFDESAGFAQSADIALGELNRFLESHPEVAQALSEGRVKFWLGGHSRGAAVSNIIAKRLTDLYCNYDGSGDETAAPTVDNDAWTYVYPEAGGLRDVDGYRFGTKDQHNQVYAFTAGTPQGGTPQRRYTAGYTYQGGYFNIHNSIDAADVVIYMAPSAMGFIRYGVDHYAPGYIVDSDAKSLGQKVDMGGKSEIVINGKKVMGPYGVHVETGTKQRYSLEQYVDNNPLVKSNDGVYSAAGYLEIRREMVSQLHAVAPNNVLEDYWHGGTISILSGKLGLNSYINETSSSYDDLRTPNAYLPNFMDFFVTYTASATGAGYRGYNGVQWSDSRFDAAAMHAKTESKRKPYNLLSTDVHDELRRCFSHASIPGGTHTQLSQYSVFRTVTLDNSNWNKGNDMTFQNAAKALMAVTLGGNSEERAQVPAVMMQKLSSLMNLGTYDDLVGDVYHFKQEKYDKYIDKIGNIFIGEPTAEEKSRGYLSLKEVIGDESYQTVQEAWPILCAVILDLENDDYQYNSFDYLGTLLLNASTFAVSHASDFTIAWLRSYDRLYNGGTAMAKHSDDMAAHRLTDLSGNPINANDQVKYDRNNPTILDPKGAKSVTFNYQTTAPSVASITYQVDGNPVSADISAGTPESQGVTTVTLKNGDNQPGGAIYYYIDSATSDGAAYDSGLPLRTKLLYNAGTGIVLPAAEDKNLEYTIRYICTAYRMDSAVQTLSLTVTPAAQSQSEGQKLMAVERVNDVTVDYGVQPELPDSVTAVRKDGALLLLPIAWTGLDGFDNTDIRGFQVRAQGTVDIGDNVLEAGAVLQNYTQIGNTLVTEVTVSMLPKPQVSMPSASLEPGGYFSSQTVGLTSAVDGAAIQYRMNGGDWTDYVEPISLNMPAEASDSRTFILEAKAAKAGWQDSEVASFQYVLSGGKFTLTRQNQFDTASLMDGGETNSYAAGDTVLLVPEQRENQVFQCWVVRSAADGSILKTSRERQFYYTMPAENVVVTAEYMAKATVTEIAVDIETPTTAYLATDTEAELISGNSSMFYDAGILWSNVDGHYAATLTIPTEESYCFSDNVACQVYSYTDSEPDNSAVTAATLKNEDGSLTVQIVFTGTATDLQNRTVTMRLTDTGFGTWSETKTLTALENSTVCLTAPMVKGEEFCEWEANDSFLGSAETLYFTVDKDITLTAVYIPVLSKLELTVDTPTGGTPFPIALKKASGTAENTFELPEELLNEIPLTWYEVKTDLLAEDDFADFNTEYGMLIELSNPVVLDNNGAEQMFLLSEDAMITVNGEEASLYDADTDAPFIMAEFEATSGEDYYTLFEGDIVDLTEEDEQVLSTKLDGYESGADAEALLIDALAEYGTEDQLVFYLGVQHFFNDELTMVPDGDEVYTADVEKYRAARAFTMDYPDGTNADTQFYAVKMPLSGENAGKLIPVTDLDKQTDFIAVDINERALYAFGWGGNGSNPGGGGSGGGGGGGSASASANAVKISDGSAFGTAVSSAASARAGEKVTITVTPNEGYEVSAVTVTDAKGNAVPVTKNADGTYSFTMPATAVTITPTFEEAGGQPADSGDVSSRFKDVPTDAWYHDAVQWAVDCGLMNGVSNDAFAPNDNTTRAMVVTMLWRMAGEPVVNEIIPYTDVPEDMWYTEAIRWAASTGAVTGMSADTFSPNEPVTREQLAAILYRYAQAQGKGFTGSWMFLLDYPDAASVSEWADEAMHWMVMHGVINGMNDGTLAPKDNATRAQIATMFMRFAEAMKK